MGISIDIEAPIKELSKWRKDLDYDYGDYHYGDDTTKHSLDTAIDVMKKYRRIQKIIKDWEDGRFSDVVGCLRVKHALEEKSDDNEKEEEV